MAVFKKIDPYFIGDGGCAWFKDNSSTSGDLGDPEVKIQRVSDK
ncbi:MAG TPA: hypothetical protein VM802_27560 [Chitinophaga sp.]|nr:hypothetical protein [Chitinophaga sp.]HVI48657.1 hypothetical protein [Chitinophaga sp.]